MQHYIKKYQAVTRTRVLASILVVAAALLVACGGSSSDKAASPATPASQSSTTTSETATPSRPAATPSAPAAPSATPFVIAGVSTNDAVALQAQYYQAVFNAMTGSGKAEDVLKFFNPACRSEIPVARFQAALDDLRKAQPKFNGQKIEQLTLVGASAGAFNNTRAPNIAVALQRADKVTIRVAGKATTVDDFMAEMGIGFIASRLDNVFQTVVAVDGKPYVAFCNEVRIWGSDIGFGNFANLAPAPKTPTPARP